MSYDKSYSSDEKKSKYNDALATLMRIGEIWKSAYRKSISWNLMGWNNDLDAVWRELSEDVEPDSNQEKAYTQINKDIVGAGLFKLKKQKGFTQLNDDDTSNRAKIFELLQKKEIFLRRLKAKQGKGTQFEDAIEDYMD